MNTIAPSDVKARGIRGGHVLGAMLAFFAIIIVADTTLIFKALTTFGGVDNPNAYRQGVAYNQRIARDAEQTLIGWHDDTEVVGRPGRLRVSLRARGGSPVAGRTLTARIGRPATNRFDATLDLAETAPGQYEAPLPAGLEGSWIVDLSAFDAAGDTDPRYQTRRRVWIRP